MPVYVHGNMIPGNLVSSMHVVFLATLPGNWSPQCMRFSWQHCHLKYLRKSSQRKRKVVTRLENSIIGRRITWKLNVSWF